MTLFMLPVRIRAWRTGTNADTQATTIDVSNGGIKSFVSNKGDRGSSLLPSAVRLW